jgi:NADPH:quinone reductase
MKAAWYEKQGPAREVLTVGDMPEPAPGPGEIRIRIAASGINPGDIKKRQDAFGYGMPYPRGRLRNRRANSALGDCSAP